MAAAETGRGCGSATPSWLAAVLPQMAQHGGVAAPLGLELQAEHEQDHQQRVQRALALDPLRIVLARHAHGRGDQLLPQLHETVPGQRRRHGTPAACLRRRALAQQRLPVRLQRPHLLNFR